MEINEKNEEITVNFENKRNSILNNEKQNTTQIRKMSILNANYLFINGNYFLNHIYYKRNQNGKYLNKTEFLEDLLLIKSEKSLYFRFYYVYDYINFIKTFIVFNLPLNFICTTMKNFIENALNMIFIKLSPYIN